MSESELEEGLRILDWAVEAAKSIRIELDDDYLALIEEVEARPENQSGADKSWVWLRHGSIDDQFPRAKLVRRAR